MLDPGFHHDLMDLAESLIEGVGDREPDHAEMARGAGTAYYAMFHAAARVISDVLIGDDPASRPNRAWVEFYRGLDHGVANTACDRAKKFPFPPEIQKFAEDFVTLQVARHALDYDGADVVANMEGKL